jgi:hypothetical protein
VIGQLLAHEPQLGHKLIRQLVSPVALALIVRPMAGRSSPFGDQLGLRGCKLGFEGGDPRLQPGYNWARCSSGDRPMLDLGHIDHHQGFPIVRAGFWQVVALRQRAGGFWTDAEALGESGVG